jgi:hypothetical protein
MSKHDQNCEITSGETHKAPRRMFRRLKGDLTGASLIAAMQASPHRDTDLEPKRRAMPVREVSL